MNREEIIKNKYSLEDFEKKTKGVYFLLWDDNIIYVGSSNNIFERIKSHIRNISKPNNYKVFNSYYYILLEVSNETLLEEEMRYINRFNPICNKVKEYKKTNKSVFYKKLNRSH